MPEGYNGLPPYYLQSSDPITPNLLLSLIGMDPIIAENFVLIDTFAAGPFGGTIDVNGVPVPAPANFVNSASIVFSVIGSNVTATASGSGSGTVTTFSAGNLNPLFTTSVATPSTTPALSFALNNQTANTVFAGPTSGVAVAPTFRSLVVADLPTVNANIGTFTYASITVNAEGLITAASSGAGSTVNVNGALVANPNFNGTTPSAPAGYQNVVWQVSGSSVSAYIPVGGAAAWASLVGDLTETQVIPWDGAVVGTPITGISSAGPTNPGFIEIGNGTPGDTSGGIECTNVVSENVQSYGTGVNFGLVVSGSLTDGSSSIGTNGQVLTSTGTLVAWHTPTVLWSNIGSATANVLFNNTSYTTIFLQNSAVAWLWENNTAGTALTTNASPILRLTALYFNGSISSPDAWSIGSSLAAGTNGASTLSITHTGSTGKAAVKVPNLIDLGTFQDSTGSVGTNGQVLTSTVTGTAWATASGSGTVTSVSFTGGLISVATPTTTPALTVAGTSGGIPYFSSASTWASSAALAAGQFVLGGGAGSAPTTSFSVIPVANGGTGTGSTLTGLLRGSASAFTASEISGDATTSGSNALTLATVNSNVGTFTYATITVNAKGLITAASSGAAGFSYVVVSKTSTYTAASGDDVFCNGTFTVTLPLASVSTRVKVSNRGTGVITVAPPSGTINGSATLTIARQYSSCEFATDGTNWDIE